MNDSKAIALARKLTKADIANFAKHIHSWDGKPDLMCQGNQKNFEYFMRNQDEVNERDRYTAIFVQDYKSLFARSILFSTILQILEGSLFAYRAVVATYTLSVVVKLTSENMDLDRIWLHQGLSPELQRQLTVWAAEVNEKLYATANGLMLSEWSKKVECRNAVLTARYTPLIAAIPEIRR